MTKEAFETVTKMRAINKAGERYEKRDFEGLARDYLKEWYNYTLICDETEKSYEVGKIMWDDEVLEVFLCNGMVYDWDYPIDV